MKRERAYSPYTDGYLRKRLSRKAKIREARRRCAINCAPILWTEHPLCRADKLDHKIRPIKVLGRLDNKCLVVQGLNSEQCTAVKAVYVYAQPRSPYAKHHTRDHNVFVAKPYDFEHISHRYPNAIQWSEL